MNVVFGIAATLLLAAFAGAQPAPAIRAECPLCKVPNRAALFAGAASSCPADCKKLCCTGTEVTLVVEGLVCTNCSSKVTAALAKLDGVHVDAVCHNTGQARVKFDPARMKTGTLIATIVAAGHPVTGEKFSLELPMLTEERQLAAVETALVTLPGVRKIATTVGAPSRVVVVFDPSVATRAEVLAVINTAKAKTSD